MSSAAPFPVQSASESLPSDGDATSDQLSSQEKPLRSISHFRNVEAHSKLLRYGIPLYISCTFALLLASDIGPSASANYILLAPDGSLFEQKSLLQINIFSSVTKLWSKGSRALAILILITSVMWPYVKLALSMAAWMLPYSSGRRRERLIEIIDALGKWSFVDIFVLLIMMVAFRSTIEAGFGIVIDVVIVPKWGFYGFVLATMLSLLGTHVVLYHHRRLLYEGKAVTIEDEIKSSFDANESDGVVNGADEEQPEVSEQCILIGKQSLASLANMSRIWILLPLSAAIALHIAGCVLDVFEISKEQSGSNDVTQYSVLYLGYRVPGSTLEPDDVGIRWIQAMYFFLAFALPLWNTFLFAVLYLFPMTPVWRELVFLLAEVTFSWSSIEVLMVCTIFAVSEIPNFGSALIDAGCEQCYSIGTSLLPEFAVLVTGTVVHCAVSVWLYRKAHAVLYHSNR